MFKVDWASATASTHQRIQLQPNYRSIECLILEKKLAVIKMRRAYKMNTFFSNLFPLNNQRLFEPETLYSHEVLVSLWIERSEQRKCFIMPFLRKIKPILKILKKYFTRCKHQKVVLRDPIILKPPAVEGLLTSDVVNVPYSKHRSHIKKTNGSLFSLS